jgi:hypothetical protein
MLKEKNKIVFKFSTAIMKLNFLVELLRWKYYTWNMIKINTKMFSFMIAVENLKTILFFSFNIDQHFELWKLIFAFLTLKSIFFLTPCKILDRYWFWAPNSVLGLLETVALGGQKCKNKPSEPKNGIWASKSVWSYFEGLFSPFWPSKVYFSLLHLKFSIDIDFGPQIPF